MDNPTVTLMIVCTILLIIGIAIVFALFKNSQKKSRLVETLEWVMPDLKEQRIWRDRKIINWLNLFTDRFEYHHSFWAEETIVRGDVDSGFNDVYNYFFCSFYKRQVGGVDFCKVDGYDGLYCVTLIITGGNDMKIYMKNREKSSVMYNKIKSWLYDIR